MCKYHRELSNECLVAKVDFETSENDPCKVCPLSVFRSETFSGSKSYCGSRQPVHPLAQALGRKVIARDFAANTANTYASRAADVISGARSGLQRSSSSKINILLYLIILVLLDNVYYKRK